MSLINGLSDPALDLYSPDRTPLLGSGAPPPSIPSPGMSLVQGGPRANHMDEADQAMGLTPQEKFLYNMHLQNLNGPGKIVHPDGSISSLLQMSFERDGKVYNIPTVWGGKQLDPADAIKAAESVGLNKFPAYNNQEEAEARYDAMHDFLGKDTGDFIESAKAAPQ